jgi:uncharacterized membrane protein
VTVQLVAVRYSSHAVAERALAAVEPLQPDDAVLVVRDTAGRVELRQTHGTSVGEAAVAGGTVGLLLGLVVGAPVGAALAGIAGGGAFGSHDTGIADDLLRRLGCELGPDEALLCLLVDQDAAPELREQLAPYAGVAVDAEASATR